ncbi:hypothetical protein ACFVAJ_19345 [Agromyces sp. NPDC057679]|uniref:hypothetical protein n=1 Tax=Agromyces sp. NPDC057679 TaxID=3346207 RepID=UPI00366B3185
MNDLYTVHATHPDGGRVVRYARRNSWWLEHPSKTSERVTVLEASTAAMRFEEARGEILTGVPGGRRFDSLVLEARIQRRKARRASLPETCGELVPRRVRPDEWVWEPCQRPYDHGPGHDSRLPKEAS